MVSPLADGSCPVRDLFHRSNKMSSSTSSCAKVCYFVSFACGKMTEGEARWDNVPEIVALVIDLVVDVAARP